MRSARSASKSQRTSGSARRSKGSSRGSNLTSHRGSDGSAITEGLEEVLW